MAKQRMTVNLNDEEGTVTATFQDQIQSFLLSGDLAPVTRHLTLLGLRTFLQDRTNKSTPETRLDDMRKAYDELVDRGMDVFARQMPRAPRTPGVRKEDKITALAFILNQTPGKIKEAIKSREEKMKGEGLADVAIKAAIAKILDDERVLAKARELRDGEVSI